MQLRDARWEGRKALLGLRLKLGSGETAFAEDVVEHVEAWVKAEREHLQSTIAIETLAVTLYNAHFAGTGRTWSQDTATTRIVWRQEARDVIEAAEEEG